MTDSTARLNMWFSNIGHLATHMFMLLYPTVVLALEHQMHLSYGELLALSVPGFILFGAAALPAGWLADRWNEPSMLIVQFLGMGLAAVATGLANSPTMIAVGLTLIGLFAAIYHPVGTSMVVRSALNRGRALGVNGIFGSLGVASAAFVAGTLTELISWRAAFIIPGLAVMALGLGFALLLRGGHVEVTKVDRKPQPPVSSRDLLWSFVALALASSCTGIIYTATTVALPKVFEERMTAFTVSSIGIGGMVSLVYAIAGVTQLLGGHLADRYPLKVVYLLSYLLQVPALLLASSLHNVPILVAASFMVALQVGTVPVESSLYARYSSSKWRATAFGAKFVISLGVSGLAVPLVGYLHDHGGFGSLFVILGALALTVAVVALVLPSERVRAPAASLAAPLATGQGD